MQDILKAVGKWLALVVVLVAVLLGAALGFMYTQVNVGDLPAYAVTFGGGELPQTGYQWKVPIAGNWLARTIYALVGLAAVWCITLLFRPMEHHDNRQTYHG